MCSPSPIPSILYLASGDRTQVFVLERQVFPRAKLSLLPPSVSSFLNPHPIVQALPLFPLNAPSPNAINLGVRTPVLFSFFPMGWHHSVYH